MDRLGLLCRNIYENNKMTQRELAAAMDLSLGTCNHLVKDGSGHRSFSLLIRLDGSYSLLKGGVDLLRKYRMDSAVILAAGFGSRFVPLTFETPKGLLRGLRRAHDRAADQAAAWGGRHGYHHRGGISEGEVRVPDRQVRRQASL